MLIRLAGVVSSFLSAVALSESAGGQTTVRVSVDSAGIPGDRSSRALAISADGRFVAFESESTNLVAGDTNDAWDVFVRDRRTGVTARVSVDSGGVQANGPSTEAAISAEGRYVAFRSSARNLVPGDTNRLSDIFVHDRLTGETSRVSVDSAGLQGDGECTGPSISADGRFVAFASASGNLVPGDTNRADDVFVHDRTTGVTACASVDAADIPRDGTEPMISADGRFVAFLNSSGSLLPGDTNGAPDVFVRDLATFEVSLVSVGSAGLQGNGASGAPSISADGRFVAFESAATNLVEGDSGGKTDVFVHDRSTGETSRVSVNSAGEAANRDSYFASISADGRHVAFISRAPNLVPSDRNARYDVYLHDRRKRATSCVSVDSAGVPGNGNSSLPSVSAEGRFVLFSSDSSNLVPDDFDTRSDAFVRNLADCRAGNVNGGAGDVVDALFVNDSAGGPERTVRLSTSDPLSIVMAEPPSAPRPTPFVLYAWRALPNPAAWPFMLPRGIGETCLPTPITGGNPTPRVIWNNTRSLLAGVPTLPSSAAPSIVVRLPRGLSRPVNAYVQGIIRDPGAPNGRAAVTNGVAIEVR